MIPCAGKIRFDGQTTHSAMLAAVIVLALLAMLVATESDPHESDPPATESHHQ